MLSFRFRHLALTMIAFIICSPTLCMENTLPTNKDLQREIDTFYSQNKTSIDEGLSNIVVGSLNGPLKWEHLWITCKQSPETKTVSEQNLKHLGNALSNNRIENPCPPSLPDLWFNKGMSQIRGILCGVVLVGSLFYHGAQWLSGEPQSWVGWGISGISGYLCYVFKLHIDSLKPQIDNTAQILKLQTLRTSAK